MVYRTDKNARGLWLVKQTLGWKNLPENFLEINRYFTLTSYCNTIGQSNNAFSLFGFSLAGKRRGFSTSYENRSMTRIHLLWHSIGHLGDSVILLLRPESFTVLFLQQIRAFVKPTDEREHAFFSARISGIHFFGKYGKTTVKSRIPRVNSSERFFSSKTAAKCRNTVAVKAFTEC